MDIHVFGCDSPFNKAFVEFMNRNFPRRGDAYVALWKKEGAAFPLPEQGNILYMPGGDFTKYKILYDLFEKGERIFAHSLFEPALSFFADYPGKKKFIYIPWGSDIAPFIFRSPYDRLDDPTRRFFYGPSRMAKATFEMVKNEWDVWRKMNLVVGKMAYVGGLVPFEQQVLNHVFNRQIGYVYFQYSNAIDLNELEPVRAGRLPDNPAYHFKKRFPRVIMLNHSGNPSNNHISLIDALAALGRDDFGVVAPLSYGDPAAIERIAKYGQEKLGDRFVPIREYLPGDQYAAILGQTDALLINTHYQGAVGNMCLMLALGRKVLQNAINISNLAIFKQIGIDLPQIDLDNNTNAWADEMFKDCDTETAADVQAKAVHMASEPARVERYGELLAQTAGLATKE